MILKLRQRMAQDESGFTLVELLVVMLILGLLAAIAIPAFFNQRDKAHDADAKSIVHSAQVAVESYATDNNGSYTGADATNNAALVKIEPTLSTPNTAGDLTVTPTATGKGYTITVDSGSGNSFTLTRADTGAESVDCSTHDNAGCPSNGDWGP